MARDATPGHVFVLVHAHFDLDRRCHNHGVVVMPAPMLLRFGMETFKPVEKASQWTHQFTVTATPVGTVTDTVVGTSMVNAAEMAAGATEAPAPSTRATATV